MNETEICGFAPCEWVRVFIHAQCLCSWLTLYVWVNAAVCSLVHHLLCRASALVGLSHLLRSSSEEIMVMFLPDPIWWPAQLTPSVGSWSSGNSHTATITQQSAELYLKVMLLAWAQEQRWIGRWLEKAKKEEKRRRRMGGNSDKCETTYIDVNIILSHKYSTYGQALYGFLSSTDIQVHAFKVKVRGIIDLISFQSFWILFYSLCAHPSQTCF